MTELVRGEASESEEEAEALVLDKAKVLAVEVSGEASESENDDGEVNVRRNDVLQQLLIGNNSNIWIQLNAFTAKLVEESTKSLASIEHLLIKSQVTLSSMLSSLKITQHNMKQLHIKSIDVCTLNFIPTISIDQTNPINKV